MEADRAQVMPAQPPREIAEKRVVRVGRHALDHQLVSGGTDRHGAPFSQ